MPHGLLPQRSIVRLSGSDTDTLLQGIITQDIGQLATQPLLYSAMLSPQGKLLYDFFIFADGNDRLIDIDARWRDDFMRSIKRYKLRADVSIAQEDGLAIYAAWPDVPAGDGWIADPRLAVPGWRRIGAAGEGGAVADAYRHYALLHGVPDFAADASERDFALELGLDQLSAISFTKGCFVGQEPTARMHYRNILRKGMFCLQRTDSGDMPPPGSDIVCGDASLGEIRAASGSVGLGWCRYAPLMTALSQPAPVVVGEAEIRITIPTYMQQKWERIAASATETSP